MKRENLWWKNTIIYELYVDKFAGNFRNLTTKLVYLKTLGIGCVWILPHYPSPMIDGGYDISDYRNIRKGLGTLEDFQEFINRAHELHIKVVIDLVLNHTSSDHPWFLEAKSSKSNSKRNYYLWNNDTNKFSLASNPFPHVSNSNWVYNKETDDYYYATFYQVQPDLNWDNPEVFSEMTRIIDFWLDKDVDGLRLDAIPRLIKREGTNCISLPETHKVIKRIREHIDNNYQNVMLIAETDEKPQDAKKYFGNGDECHMAFNFYLAMKTWLALKRKDLSISYKAGEEAHDIPENCRWGTFLTNHDAFALYLLDEKEKLEIANWLDPECKFSSSLGSTTSMRVAEVFKGDKSNIISAFKTLLNLSGTPIIYYGEEVGMRNMQFKEKPAETRLFIRGDFDWKEAERQLTEENSLLNEISILMNRYKFEIRF